MLEIFLGVTVVLSTAIALSLMVAGIFVFMGAVNGIDDESIFEEDE